MLQHGSMAKLTFIPDDPSEFLSIGDVAHRAGKRASSIRYYEQVGLLPEPIRVSGRRRYPSHTVRTLAVIETGQRAGLALGEIKTLLQASSGDGSPVDQLRQVAARKLPEIAALIERAELAQVWLEHAARCGCSSLDECPLFDDPDLMPAGDRNRNQPGAFQAPLG